MRDGLPRGYDEWRTRNAEDEADRRLSIAEREEMLLDRADHLRDEERDDDEPDPRKWSYYDEENDE
jgi:hypothetical protein